MGNFVRSGFEMTPYEQRPAAYGGKYLPACLETQGCFNHDMINNPALKIGFKNNYRRRMGEVQFLNQNHFNYGAQRMWKDLCWWISAATRQQQRQSAAGSLVETPQLRDRT